MPDPNTYTPKSVSRDDRRSSVEDQAASPEDVQTAVEAQGDDIGLVDPAAPEAFETEVDLSPDLASPVAQPYDRDYLSRVAEDFDDLRQFLEQPTSTGRGLVDPGLPTSTYMRRLRNQTTNTTDPDRGDPQDEDGESEFGAYLRDVAEEIVQATDQATYRLRSEMNRLDEEQLEIICCIINGIYQLASRDGTEAIEDFRNVRAVAEDTVRDWVDLLIELLESYQEMSAGGYSGKLTFVVSILYTDLTAVIEEALEAVIAGIMFSVVQSLQDFADRVNDDITDVLEKTNCPPLLRIWSAIYDYIFGTTSGLLARTMQFFQDTITTQARKRRKAAAAFSVDAIGTGRVDDLLAILRAIRAAVNLFDKCRVPEDPRRGNRDPETQIRDEAEDIVDDVLGKQRNEDDRTSSPGTDGPSGSPPGDTGSGTPIEDPDVGPVQQVNTGRDDLLYLTPTNAAKLMVSEFGADPETALDLARNQNCQDQLSDETAEILREVGVIDD